jgi:hypothetical protein
MRTTIDAINLLYTRIAASDLKLALTGDVYKEDAPINMNVEKENVVINGLGINNEQLQKGTFNVNIFVPDLDITVEGISQKARNDERFKELTDIAIEVVDEYWMSDCYFTVQQHNLLFDETLKQWFSNIRVEFYSENFKN